MNEADLTHLRRCVDLAAEAVEHGDQPFGSVLVSGDGTVLAERRNRSVTTGDLTAHPERALAGWASQHRDPSGRAAATMYTSGEHCTMCAAAHVRVGIGRLVYVLSAPMIAELVEPDVKIGLRMTQIARVPRTRRYGGRPSRSSGRRSLRRYPAWWPRRSR